MREVSQVHLCSCLFYLFKDFVSHSAPNRTRRQQILKWTERHIKWACRSYRNSIWVVSSKSRFPIYLQVLPAVVYLSLWRSRVIHSTVLDQLSGCYGSVTVMVQTHQETVHGNCPAEAEQQRAKQDCFTCTLCEREAIFPLPSQQESWKKWTKLRTHRS